MLLTRSTPAKALIWFARIRVVRDTERPGLTGRRIVTTSCKPSLARIPCTLRRIIPHGWIGYKNRQQQGFVRDFHSTSPTFCRRFLVWLRCFFSFSRRSFDSAVGRDAFRRLRRLRALCISVWKRAITSPLFRSWLRSD
jgi:hypothetical protein